MYRGIRLRLSGRHSVRIRRASDRLSLQDRRRQVWLYPRRWCEAVDWFIARTCHARDQKLHAKRRETNSRDTLGGYIFSTGEETSNNEHYTWYAVATCNYWSTTEEIYYIEWKVSHDDDATFTWRYILPWNTPMSLEVYHKSPTENYMGDIAVWAHCYEPGPMWV